MAEFSSAQWHEVVHAVSILQDMLQRHVSEAAPVLGSRKIRRHVGAIADELGALYQEAAAKMDKAAKREEASHG
jgi:hypothetical protein